MEQSRKSRNKTTQLRSVNLQQRGQGCTTKSLFNKLCWENWAATCKRVKLDYLIPYTKINLKWIEDPNVRPDTIKLLVENIGGTFSDINHSNVFLDLPPRVMEIKAKINKWDLIKLKKNLLHSKGTHKQNKEQQHREWEKNLQAMQPIRDSFLKTAHTAQCQKNTNNPIKKWAELNRHFSTDSQKARPGGRNGPNEKGQ